MIKILFLTVMILVVPNTFHAETLETSTVGTWQCLSVQQEAQDAVTVGGPYKNQGQRVKEAAKVVSQYINAAYIDEQCASCIIHQFAQGIGIAAQTPCGEAQVACPCWTEESIDVYARVFMFPYCNDSLLETFPFVWDVFLFSDHHHYEFFAALKQGAGVGLHACLFEDVPNDVYVYSEFGSMPQFQMCYEILKASLMWELNCSGY